MKNEKEIFHLRNSIINKTNTRYSKSVKDIKDNLDNLRQITKAKTHFNKDQKSDKNITKQDVFDFFRKGLTMRSNKEVIIFAKYLSENYQYFKKIKAEDSQLKVEQITRICRLEKIYKNESIINYGEIGDKFYIVLEGIVEVYRPKYIDIELYPNEFMTMLNKIKNNENNLLKYERIKEKNKIFFDVISNDNEKKNINEVINVQKAKSRIDINLLKNKQVFIMEEEEKLGEYGEGFSFGEIALIKKTGRNATIKAKINCVLLSIENNEYNKAILEYQKKKLNNDIEDFIKTYSFFKDFSQEKIIRLFNCFSKKTIYKGECLYEQNKKDENIYIINEGIFSISYNISFSWLNDYFNYIDYSKKNILHLLIKSKKIKYSDLLKIIQDCNSKLNSNNSPLNKNKYDLWEKTNERKDNDDLYRLKMDEEKLNEPDNVYNIEIKKINYNEILGIEEVFDFKKRFCTCKCLSEKAEIRYISMYDLLKLIIKLGEDEIKYLLNLINEKKKIIKSQIIKAIKVKERNIVLDFDTRYEKLLKDAENKKTNKIRKNNQIFSTLKMKGIKNNLQDILDNNIKFLKSSNERKLSKDNSETLLKNKSSEMLLRPFYIKRKPRNKVKFKIIKNIISQKENEEIINSQINSMANTNKLFFRKHFKSPTRNSRKINYSASTTTKINKRKPNNYSMDIIEEIIKPRIENTPSKNNMENSNTIEQTPIVKNIKDTNKINNLNKDSQDFKICQYSDKKITNLPKLIENKSTWRKKSNIQLTLNKGTKSYNEFYKIYSYDKNMLVSNQFQIKLMKEKNKIEEKKKLF